MVGGFAEVKPGFDLVPDSQSHNKLHTPSSRKVKRTHLVYIRVVFTTVTFLGVL